VGWLALQASERSVNFEVVSSEGVTRSAALVTAEMAGAGEGSQLTVTVQLSSLAEDMEPGYQQGFGAGLDNLAALSERTMVLERVIQAPRARVWEAWTNPETLPRWWGLDGFSCRTKRIDLKAGGEWIFDMIAPDGTVFPNHHLYRKMRAEEAADAWQAGALRWSQVKPRAVAAPGPRAREEPDAEAGFRANAADPAQASRLPTPDALLGQRRIRSSAVIATAGSPAVQHPESHRSIECSLDR
jgi:hypothetical protein